MLEVPGYRIEAEVGRGGWSVVYRAIDHDGGFPVAVKVIAPELAGDEDFRERFRREAEIASAVDHPHVVPIYEVGDGYVVMQWIEGRTLRELAPLDSGRAARIVAQVAAALDVLHSRGIVHRDVKPGNILVEARLDGDHAYLTDFGLAKEISPDPGLAAPGRWHGTVDFAAPEQIRGQPTDARSDVYSLGCVLGFALTGSVPYARADPAATMQAHLHEPPPQLAPPRARFNEVIARALAKDPNWRFASAGDLGRAAVAVAGGVPKPSGRGRAVAIAVGVAAGVLILGLGFAKLTSSGEGGGEQETLDDTEAPPGSGTRTVEIAMQPVGANGHTEIARFEQIGAGGTVYFEGRLPPPPRGSEYVLWLYNDRRDAVFLGPMLTDRKGHSEGSVTVPDDVYERYQYLELSLERDEWDERHEGRSVLRGGLAGVMGPGP